MSELFHLRLMQRMDLHLSSKCTNAAVPNDFICHSRPLTVLYSC